MNEQNKIIRKKFGEQVRKYRESGIRKISQDELSKKINRRIFNKNSCLSQKKISRIELADESLFLVESVIDAISTECNIPIDISEPFIKLMKDFNVNEDNDDFPILIIENDQLLSKPIHSELQIYEGDYFCYFYSTDSSNPTIIKGKLSFLLDYKNSICRTELQILKNKKTIKQYKGQFVLNLHYRKIYIVLVGCIKQEICFLVLNHFNSTINPNKLNMALVLTTLSGSQKRLTAHRMLITRKELNDKTLSFIEPELKLNTDVINLSEEELNELENELVNSKSKYAGSALKCVKYIKENAKKKIIYYIDESIIYDSSEISQNDIERSYIISLLRKYSDTKYYNKISDTIEEICLKIIESME